MLKPRGPARFPGAKPSRIIGKSSRSYPDSQGPRADRSLNKEGNVLIVTPTIFQAADEGEPERATAATRVGQGALIALGVTVVAACLALPFVWASKTHFMVTL